MTFWGAISWGVAIGGCSHPGWLVFRQRMMFLAFTYFPWGQFVWDQLLPAQSQGPAVKSLGAREPSLNLELEDVLGLILVFGS